MTFLNKSTTFFSKKKRDQKELLISVGYKRTFIPIYKNNYYGIFVSLYKDNSFMEYERNFST